MWGYNLEVSIQTCCHEVLLSSMQAIPNCVSETTPAKYDVVTAEQYIKSRFQAVYGGNSWRRF